MLTTEQHQKIYDLFAAEIQGGTADYMESILDKFIEEGDLDEELVRANEAEIARLFDDNWFTCNSCNWTLPIAEMANNDNWECNDCA